MNMTSVANALRRTRELYCQKNVKKADFAFEHSWVLLRDHPRWANGWTQPKSPIGKRKAGVSKGEVNNLMDADNGAGVVDPKGA